MSTQENKIYEKDIGTKIILDLKEDISIATIKRIHYKTPKGKTGIWEGVVDSNTNYLYYITEENDLTGEGRWKLQAEIKMPDWHGKSETATLVVSEKFK